jgi:hypothetical protein
MRIRGSLAKGLIAALALTLVPLVAFSATKIIPGSTCKVLNQKVVYQNKTYTCIKSGKKLVWNKGVVVKKPTPIPTATPTPTPTPTLAGNIIDKCLGNINDSRLTKEIFLSIIGLTEVDLLSAVTNNSWYISLATNGGEFGVNHAFSPDIYCGNSQNNFVRFLDSSAETKDYFFGGAGNDSVETAWNSEFFGGDGNDVVTNLLEKSIFHGGDGNDSVSNMASDTKYLEETSTVYSLRLKPTPTPTPSPTPTPTPINTNIITDATRFIQSLIIDTPITNTKNKTKIVMHVEMGENGPYPEIVRESISVALNFYASLGMVLNKETIHVLLGRTQVWMHEKSNVVAPGCVINTYKFSGAVNLCPYPDRSVISIHLPSAVTANGNTPDNVNFSNETEVLKYTTKKVLDNFTGAGPHEAHHAWQISNIGAYTPEVPDWVWEGSASLFGEMIYFRLRNPTQNYLTFEPGLYGWGKSVCLGPVETMKHPCQYTQGIIILEYFLNRFGIDSYVKLFSQDRNITFPVRFENATKVSLVSFYADVNKYLTLKGWNN